jgi:hypothetical protein
MGQVLDKQLSRLRQGLNMDLVNPVVLQPLMNLFDNRYLLAYTFRDAVYGCGTNCEQSP